MPRVFIIAGPNGAGKTTASAGLLPELLGCNEFVNADDIARALSPFNPERVAWRAGRLMLEVIRQLAASGEDFASKQHLPRARSCRSCENARAKATKSALFFFGCARRALRNGGLLHESNRVVTRFLGKLFVDDIGTGSIISGLSTLLWPIIGSCTIIRDQHPTLWLAAAARPRSMSFSHECGGSSQVWNEENNSKSPLRAE